MAINESHTVAPTAEHESHGAESTVGDTPMTGDRYCRHCSEIALAYDPSASRARCRACGTLA